MNVGKVLKKLRKYKGVTQENIANFLNLERTSYAKLEKDKTMLRLDTAKLIAIFYGFELHYLILCMEYDNYVNNPTTIRLIKAQKEREALYKKQTAYSA
ncbi:helix-turn-helix domain-containing protein [Pedobacter sp. SL55]|uniref:helix-turn-helix domain-containing protein n=1 Tax=Pedobacter sp. SL55 TaxID=2995161 RepID=UPI0022714AFF|nr:helix-turn-helix transcriptional regulator [Pedobacter sp. SL55]WAC41385.1 helix-turn-helix transcriptional regulator [Pedobacter sp. SL55]